MASESKIRTCISYGSEGHRNKLINTTKAKENIQDLMLRASRKGILGGVAPGRARKSMLLFRFLVLKQDKFSKLTLFEIIPAHTKIPIS